MKIGLVSTFNVECGISTYSEHLTTFYPIGNTIIFANKLLMLSDTQINLLHPIFRCWNRLGDYKELTQKVLDSQIDIVHFQHEFGLFQNFEAFEAMIQELKNKGIKIVITFHTVFSDGHHILNYRIIKLLNYVDLVIVHHQKIKEILDFKNCVVIPHGSVKVKPKQKSEARKYLNIPDDKFVCMFLGFISPNKGQIEASIAISNLKKEFSNIYLLIAGLPVINGSNFENLEYCLNLFRGVRRMNSFDVIRIIPRFITEQDFDYYAGAADIFIENHGYTQYSTSGISHLIMSYGKPSVSSRSFILNDLNEERSVKFNIGDINGMEESIKKLILDNSLREELGKNALEFAKETYWDRIAKKHLELYETLL